MANLDILFVIIAAARPDPSLPAVDRLLASAEYRSVEPVIVITKRDLSPSSAATLADIYTKAGYPVFLTQAEESPDAGLTGWLEKELPGHTAAYPSTVLMNAVPAKIAGCSQIAMVSPPGPDGKQPDAILAAARIAGVDRVFRLGGAQGVAALACGTESVPKVDKIVGPGSAYVSEAKRQVFGRVDIDMIAGPSEILVIADETCDPALAAADLLSQAEHDVLATAVLVTDSQALAEAVRGEVERQLCLLPREAIARQSVENNGKIIVTDDLLSAAEAANAIAPEHLEICVDDPALFLDRVKNAGSVFLGKYCPEALGDYLAGPNHTLPTAGAARFSSPLGVDDFVKKTQYTYFTPEALRAVSGDIALFARREGLEAHARSALARFEKEVLG